jgi:hypothetical protein
VPGISQAEVRELFEVPRRIETRRKLVRDRLVVNKAVCAGRADGLFVEAHRIKVPAFDACGLGAYQRNTVLEIFRAILRPYFELSVVGGQSLEMLPVPIGK